MSSLIKSILMFQKGTIPPQAGMPHPLNPNFPRLDDINIVIPSAPMEFPSEPNKPRRILLNNFDAAVSCPLPPHPFFPKLFFSDQLYCLLYITLRC
jgi:hypothetical protein